MVEEPTGREGRHIQIHTARGALRGQLLTSSVVRTLDDLNLVARNFVTFHEPERISGDWELEGGPILLAKDSIWFVQEFSRPSSSGSRGAAPRCVRAPVRVWIRDHSIQGFLHVPAGGTAASRLNNAKHPFLALTSASVVSPDSQFAAPFLALGCRHILGAQELAVADDSAPAQRARVEV